MKKRNKYLIFALFLLFLCTTTYVLRCFYVLYKTPVRVRQTKDYNSIYVDNTEISADYRVFIDIPEKYGALEQIDPVVRQKIADYMKENNLMLSDGEQEFYMMPDGEFDELIGNFKFSPRPSGDIMIDTENSYFNDFTADGQNVFFHCCLYIDNNGAEKEVEITAADNKDAAAGLLSSPDLCGIDPGTLTKTTYTLKNGVNIIDVTFMGSQGTGTQKADRLLPGKIYIYEVN